MSSLSVTVTPTGAPLSLTCFLDGKYQWHGRPLTAHQLTFQFDDQPEQSHVLELRLEDKQQCHTKIDQQGHIIADSLIHIDRVRIDGFSIDQFFYSHCHYSHASNGSGPRKQYAFWGTMGCNGTVTFRWQSPFYLWYLEQQNQ